MPEVSTVGLRNQTAISENQSRTASNELAGDDFMKLFITQLRYQDPTSPMDTNQMLAQVTQLATMEGLANIQEQLTESFSLNMMSTASGTIGKKVTYVDNDGNELTGTVTSTTVNNGAAPVLKLDTGNEVSLDSIASIN